MSNLPVDEEAIGRAAKLRLDSIAKPIDSLGLLEDLVVKVCKIKGSISPKDLGKRGLVVLCADHGVVAEGVTQTGKEVTRIVAENFAAGCSTVNLMAERAGVDVFPVDVGMDTEHYENQKLQTGMITDRKVGRGTGNLLREPAMSTEDCQKTIEIGIELVRELAEKGYGILATGEMGIGNTTPTSVLAALYLGLSADEVTGRGAGISAAGFHRKKEVVAGSIERIKKLTLSGSLEILAQAGGYEIAAMVGMFLGGVKYHIPIVIDGAISAVAALAAYRMDQKVREIAIASHVSGELTGQLALQELSLEAPIHARMCLGEGTGAMTIFPLLDMAFDIYEKMGAFTDYEITPYERFGNE